MYSISKGCGRGSKSSGLIAGESLMQPPEVFFVIAQTSVNDGSIDSSSKILLELERLEGSMCMTQLVFISYVVASQQCIVLLVFSCAIQQRSSSLSIPIVWCGSASKSEPIPQQRSKICSLF